MMHPSIKLTSIILMSVFLVSCASTYNKNIQKNTASFKAAELNVQLGLSYLQRGDYNTALEKLKKALQQNPKSSTAHNTIALLYQQLGVLDKAEYHFQKSVEFQPNYSEAQNNFGVFLCQKKAYKEAEEHFLRAIENPLYTSADRAYENAGLCVNRIPDQTLAKHYFRKALQLNPRLAKSLLQMAKLSYLNIDYEDAQSYMERYQTIAAWTASALLTAIMIKNKLNDQNAVASYTLLIKSRFPDSAETQKVKEGLY